MNSENIFIGDVRICTHYQSKIDLVTRTIQHNPSSKLFKEDVVLIKMGNNKYVSIGNYTLFLKIALFFNDNTYLKCPYNKIMDITPLYPGGILFVDESSLRPYYTESKDVSLKELRRGLKR